jgi:hypothetical protein
MIRVESKGAPENASIHFGNIKVLLLRRARHMFDGFLTFRQFLNPREDILIMHLAQQVMDAIQTGFVLVITFNGIPGSKRHVGEFEHSILGF